MNYKKLRMEAFVLTMVLLVSTFFVPVSSIKTNQINNSHEEGYLDVERSFSEESGPYWFDQKYDIRDPFQLNIVDYDDAGYRKDAGDSFTRSNAIYPSELADDTPGRGVTGKLSSSDDEDWYYFSVCNGQDINVTMSPDSGFDFDLALWDESEILKDSSSNGVGVLESVFFTSEYTGHYFMQIVFISGTGEGSYTFDFNLSNQNDAGTGDDAGDTFVDAVFITPDIYTGYLDMEDPYDWYKFNINSGEGIHFYLDMRHSAILSDFDISLYNPTGEFVFEEDLYYDDELFYPADVSGEWRVKIDIFPGWIDCPHPENWSYYSYGSGAYELEFVLESGAPDPPSPIPQPDISPIAKTFIIENDHNSYRDEFGYLASIPACNYLDGEQRFLAPIIYEGDDTETEYHGTGEDRGVVDDTTQYFLDDWNDYLASYNKSAVEYNVPLDPIEASAAIAQNNWISSDLAVVAVDGSLYEDTTKTVLSKTKTLNRKVEVETIPNDSPDIVVIGGSYNYLTTLNKKWCAINVSLYGTGNAEPSINAILPHFMRMNTDWWPHPYDNDGPKYDIYYPITRKGIWSAGTNTIGGDWFFEITKYAGHRYKIWVKDSDSSIHVKINTDTPSDLLVFLIDPEGHLRAPDIPYWNGPINPIHMWNGCDFDPSAGGYGPWRVWNPGLHTEFSAEVLHPEKGFWTVIVVPRNAEGPDYTYDITAEVTYTNPKRADAAVSAANAAVIASLEHAPLLYVTEDSIPPATQSAISALGVNKVIFVERGGIGSSVSGLPTVETDLTTMQEIIDYIKKYPSSENYITITSIKYSKGESTSRYGGSGGGYFAQAANIGAYHGSPVLRIGDAAIDGIFKTKFNPGGMSDRIETWRLWSGDYYHGSRSCGHLPIHDSPINQTPMQILIEMLKYILLDKGELPPFGLDAKRYWNEELHDGIYNWISNYGLDLDGQEGYCFVAPRKNIYIPAHFVMMGNSSYAGHIPGFTPAYTSALVARSLLYPAVIFANPNRDIVTTQAMNFPDGNSWTTNDGESHQVYSTRNNKKSLGSHGRTFEGHTFWRAHLERMNSGASALYYSGHGTGGSGISAQFEQTEFCNFPNQVWWDGWRGYMYDNWKMSRANGHTWYNPDPGSGGLYDFVHFDYHDQLFKNLRSNAVFWMSCTTADANGPMIYLDHGAVMFYGNAGSGLRVEGGLQDQEFFKDVFIYGEPVGKAYSKQVWLHFRDFTTKDPTSMYGSSSIYGDEGITTVQCIYGDPNLIIYSPEWTSPEPIYP